MQKTQADIRYDEWTKKFLARKLVLAHILVNIVDEFRGMDPQDVSLMIEKPVISTEKVDSVGTDINDMIAGSNTEDSDPNEGTIRYDVRFTVHLKNRDEILFDIEVQDEFYPGYYLGNRISYYCGRMISSQKGRTFRKSDYNNVKKCYCIWICTDCPDSMKNTITSYPRVKTNIVGNADELEGLDKVVPIVIGISTPIVAASKETKLLRLLELFIFSNYLTVEEKKTILLNEYGIKTDDELEGGLVEMCNLSQQIRRESADAMGEAMSMLYSRQCASVEELVKNKIPEDIANKAMHYFTQKAATC